VHASSLDLEPSRLELSTSIAMASSATTLPQLVTHQGMRAQLVLISLLVFATGWVVGVAKLSQVLMTSEQGRFVTHSEGRAEAFLLTFGLSKAFGNLLVGGLADSVGRKPSMVIGWGVGALFCLCSLLAPTWEVIVASDVLLGLNQASAVQHLPALTTHRTPSKQSIPHPPHTVQAIHSTIHHTSTHPQALAHLPPTHPP
jgi:MFS family permease